MPILNHKTFHAFFKFLLKYHPHRHVLKCKEEWWASRGESRCDVADGLSLVISVVVLMLEAETQWTAEWTYQ